MGLLDNIKYNAQQLARGLLNAPSSIGQMFTPEYAQKLSNALQTLPTDPLQVPLQSPMMQREMLNQGLNIAGMAPVLHTVYHGSPYKFDKFDISKIGTGEGAQAYGHGLYFAENPGVAKSYQEKLSGSRDLVDLNGHMDRLVSGNEKLMDKNLPMARELVDYAMAGDSKGATDFLANQSQRWGELMHDPSYPFKEYAMNAKVATDNALAKVAKNGINYENGTFYKVDIPDESIPRMLNWDKPLSEQHPDVQQILKPYVNDLTNDPKWGDLNSVPITVRDAYNRLAGVLPVRNPGPQSGMDMATQYLKQNGIPGIRYLDGNSRGVGQGSSNYVLFDDQLARILERNGQPTGLQPWKPGEWPGLLK